MINQNIFIFTLLSVACIAALLGGLIIYIRSHKQLATLREQNTALQTTLDMERSHANEKLSAIEKTREQLVETFGALSGQALKHNSEEFLKLAQENLKQFQLQAKNDLTEKEKAIENLVKPIKEALDKTEKQIRNIEHERKEAYGALHQHLQTMAQTQQA